MHIVLEKISQPTEKEANDINNCGKYTTEVGGFYDILGADLGTKNLLKKKSALGTIIDRSG